MHLHFPAVYCMKALDWIIPVHVNIMVGISQVASFELFSPRTFFPSWQLCAFAFEYSELAVFTNLSSLAVLLERDTMVYSC